MTNEEREIRLEVATEIIEKVHSDLCNDPETNREASNELCCIIHQLLKFKNKLNQKGGNENE